MKGWSALPLRLGLGIVFLAYGLHNAFALFGGGGIESFSNALSAIGFTPSILWAYIIAYIQLVGGLLLLLGLFTTVVSVILTIVVAFLSVKINLPSGFFIASGGIEYGLILVCALLSLAMSGAGNLVISVKK